MLVSKCFCRECMWQLWENFKGWQRLWLRTLEEISSITIIFGMTYSKYLSQSLLYHRHFFHSSFYSSFSFSWEKNNVIFLHCNKNTRPNKIEADDSNCTVIYCIFISGLVSFPLWVQKKKWKLTTDFHFSFFYLGILQIQENWAGRKFITNSRVYSLLMT